MKNCRIGRRAELFPGFRRRGIEILKKALDENRAITASSGLRPAAVTSFQDKVSGTLTSVTEEVSLLRVHHAFLVVGILNIFISTTNIKKTKAYPNLIFREEGIVPAELAIVL